MPGDPSGPGQGFPTMVGRQAPSLVFLLDLVGPLVRWRQIHYLREDSPMAATKKQRDELAALQQALGQPADRELKDGAVHCIVPGCDGWATRKYVATVGDERKGICPRKQAHDALVAADPELKAFVRVGMQLRDLARIQNGS